MKRIYDYDDIQPILERLTADKESGEIEFKSSKGGFPHSFWQTYSSFANTNGGTIIFGVREKDGQFLLDGITREQAEKYMRDFFNNMHSKQNVNIPLLTERDVQMVKLDGAYFLFFYIHGLEDEHVLNSLVTEQPLSAYIPRKDGSFYVNLGNEENEMLLSNYSKNKGQGLYDTALGSHGGMGAKYENGVLHFEDVIDYQPFQSYKKLPGFVRKFEPSTIIPGAKPFKWSGDIRVSNYIDPALYERYIQQGIGEGPLVREATGKAYLPMSEEDFNARISKIVDDYLKSHPIGLK